MHKAARFEQLKGHSDNSGDPSHISQTKTNLRCFSPFFPQTWNMHHRPNRLKWKGGVIFISCLVPYTAQIDLPCYVSDQITTEPALTSAFGISRRTTFHALLQSSMHEFEFLVWGQLRCPIYFCSDAFIKEIWGTFKFFLSWKWFKVSFFVHIKIVMVLINVLDTV